MTRRSTLFWEIEGLPRDEKPTVFWEVEGFETRSRRFSGSSQKIEDLETKSPRFPGKPRASRREVHGFLGAPKKWRASLETRSASATVFGETEGLETKSPRFSGSCQKYRASRGGVDDVRCQCEGSECLGWVESKKRERVSLWERPAVFALTVRLRSQCRPASLARLVGRRSTVTVGADGSSCDQHNLTSNSFHSPSDGAYSSVRKTLAAESSGRCLPRGGDPCKGPCQMAIDSSQREPSPRELV